jgi:hypothetical protein
MRPRILAGLVAAGLAAAGAVLFVAWPEGESLEPGAATAAIAFHAESPDWAVAQSFRPGAQALRFRITRTGLERSDKLVLNIYADGRMRHSTSLERQTGRGRPGRASWDGMADGAPLAPGRYDLELEARRGGALIALSARRPLTVLNLDLDVDTDRDGAVTEDDEEGEGEVTAQRGAYFAVNYDADGLRRDETGQLLSDSIVFDDLTGEPIALDDRIENEADRDGLAPLVIRSLGAPLPPGVRVFLRAAEREDIESVQIYARREPGARAIWGGLGTRTGGAPVPTEIDITRFIDPDSPDFAGTEGSADLTFAVEGLFFRNDPQEARGGAHPVLINQFDGDIDLYLEIRHADKPGRALYADHVRMRVTPWIMLPATNRSLAVFARDGAEENVALMIAQEPGYSGLSESGKLILVRGIAESEKDADFRWLQDHAVFGMYQLPGAGPEQRTHAALRLPYEVEDEIAQPQWVADHLMGPAGGVFQFGSWLGSDPGAPERAGGGHGGNIDVIPPSESWPLGRIVTGDTMPAGLRVFLKSQRVQPLVTLPTQWLAVGHIDEMIGFTGQGGETLIADPVLAYRLLEAIPREQRGESVFFATGRPVAGTVKPPAPGGSRKAQLRRLDTGIDHRGSGMRYVRIYRDGGSGAAGQVARIAPGGLRNGHVLIDQVWQTATRVIPGRKGEPSVLQFIGADDDDESEPSQGSQWLDLPRAGDRFVMVRDTKFWFDGAPAVITVEEVLADERLRRLNIQNIASRLAAMRSQLQREGGRDAGGAPFLHFVSVPVLFAGRPGSDFVTSRSAVGFTPNLANSQPVGEHIYMPRQFAPLGPDGRDIFETAVREALGERVRFVDTWDAYHRQFGEVHCATSVLRGHFTFDWWSQRPPLHSAHTLSGPGSSGRLIQRNSPRKGSAQATPATAKKTSSAAQ